MKRIALLSSCALTVLVLATLVLATAHSAAAAETGQVSEPAVLDLQALQTDDSAAPLTPAQQDPPALPLTPIDQRIEKVCFWYPTGQCCAGGFQIEEWICDPDLTRCGPRTC
jgi:hypothetical protein